jgi:periplasmic divalent cation tolerance protein
MSDLIPPEGIGPDDCVIIVTACPHRSLADRLSETLVSDGLAAAVHIRKVRTRYRWKGQIESGTEYILDIYAPRAALADVEARILAHHPYEMPPIHALPILTGAPAYLDWIRSAGHVPGADE